MPPLSIIYTTFNEADILERSLDSIRGLSDDVIVVDSFSTDATPQILAARADTLATYDRAYQGPSDQKNWALDKARHDYVLIMDADEVLRPELRTEIEQLLRRNELLDAYWIGRNNFFMGRQIKHSGWAGEKVIRLVRREVARYNDRQVHEEIELEGLTVGRLEGKMDHFLFKNLDHFWDKNRRYARWSAGDKAGSTGRITAFHLLVKPVYRFLKHYVIQGGFRDGKEGLMLSMIIGYSVFQRYAYLLERRRSQKE